jgi:translation initiation factor 5
MDKTQQPYVIYMTSAPLTIAIDPAMQTDPFYRYKMRQLQVQVIGNGKMVRTSLTNLEDVSKDLHLPPAYIPNYLAKVIGAQAKYDKKKPERERGSISGEYPLPELSDHLVRFIREFVLCKKCRYPELTYSGQGNKKDVRMTCRSCGWKGLLTSAKDINEKFRRFAINNPPTKTTIMTTNAKKAPPGTDAIVNAAVAASSSKSTDSADSTSASSSSSKNGDKAVSPAEARKKADDDWAIDTSEEAAKERMETLVPDRLKALVASEKAKDEPAADQLRKLLATKPTADQVVNDVVRLVKENFLDEPARNALLFEAVFSDVLGDLKKLVERVKTAKTALQKFITSNPTSQRELIVAMDSFANKQPVSVKPGLMKLAPSILKFLYDEEVLDEESILIWYGGLVNKPTQFAKAAEPFCKWLEEADEESDGEGEEGEEDEEEEGDEDEEDVVPEAKPVDTETLAEIDAL